MSADHKFPWGRLGVLWVLYTVQGMPYGFQLTALPLYLREAGVSRTEIGFLSVLSLPWLLKVLWSPLIDRFGSPRLGRRRSWILPLQLGLAITCAVAVFFPPEAGLRPLLYTVLVMNFFAATMDVAVDGLAVDTLAEEHLGQGNIAQVVGFKLGMLTGGGLLVWLSARFGWSFQFGVMAVLVLLAFVVTFVTRPRDGGVPEGGASDAAPLTQGEGPMAVSKVLGLMKKATLLPGAGWLILAVMTYKFGETLVDTMFKPFLVDSGFSVAQIGLWAGGWGLGFSLAGSFAGGLLASRISILRAVGIAALLRVGPVVGEWWLTQVEPTPGGVVAVICAENFFGGALTTAMFAYMMSRVDRRIGAAHYTFLASLEVWGKMPARWLSGWLADQTSYATVFAIGVVASVLFLAIVRALAQAPRRESSVQTAP